MAGLRQQDLQANQLDAAGLETVTLRSELVPKARLAYCTREVIWVNALRGAARIAARTWDPSSPYSLSRVRARRSARFSAWRLGIWGVSVRPADRSLREPVPDSDPRPIRVRELDA